MKKLTVEELIKRNVKKDKTETFEIEVERLGGTITCKTFTKSEMVELIGQMTNINESDTTQMLEANNKMLYNCIIEPNLRDKNLQDAYGIKAEPYKIIEELLDFAEIGQIAQIVMNKNGFNNANVRLVTDIKKQ